MSKIRPVRWWRDDATRYQSRSSYKAPPLVDQPIFVFSNPPPLWLMEALNKADAYKISNGFGLNRSMWEESKSTPIDDILEYMKQLRAITRKPWEKPKR